MWFLIGARLQDLKKLELKLKFASERASQIFKNYDFQKISKNSLSMRFWSFWNFRSPQIDHRIRNLCLKLILKIVLLNLGSPASRWRWSRRGRGVSMWWTRLFRRRRRNNHSDVWRCLMAHVHSQLAEHIPKVLNCGRSGPCALTRGSTWRLRWGTWRYCGWLRGCWGLLDFRVTMEHFWRCRRYWGVLEKKDCSVERICIFFFLPNFTVERTFNTKISNFKNWKLKIENW